MVLSSRMVSIAAWTSFGTISLANVSPGRSIRYTSLLDVGMPSCSVRPGHISRSSASNSILAGIGGNCFVMERSHISLPKWVLGFHLMAASKKGMSSAQLGRMLGITYKAAWFMSHRIREAMTDPMPSPIGGEGKVIEADEAYLGRVNAPVPSAQREGRPYLKRKLRDQKRPIVALVERGGEVRVKHMPLATAETIREHMVRTASRKSRLHTDESRLYPTVGAEFAAHETVRHSAGEYARGDVTTNSVEGFFGVLMRGMKGVYQHWGEQHFQRYLNEFAFRYNNRIALGVDDEGRAAMIVVGAAGKRLTYQGTRAA